MTTTRRGADLLVEALKSGGVRYLFTLSGNQIMPIFDASIGSGLELIHVRHEAAAVHMADAWGRLTGEPVHETGLYFVRTRQYRSVSAVPAAPASQ